jgi:3-hydroxyisobutyrate dehydrogenase
MADPVALIGVGRMGRALLPRLIGTGSAVRAFDIRDEPMRTARELGAETVACSAEAADGAARVHVLVSTDEDVLDATLGADGALAGAGSGTVVILHSTILPATTQRVARAASEHGVGVLDASITAVPRCLAAGEAMFLVGGPDELVAAARPHLMALGRAVCHFGPHGAGNAAKIAKNLSNAVERVTLAETVRIVEAAGLDVRQFLDMAREAHSGAMIDHWERAIAIDDGHARPQRARGLLSKDIRHAATLARALGLELPVTESTAATAARWVREWAETPE